MRTMWTPMGAASGNQRGTKGMPEVQKPVLEHAATEAQNPQVTGDTVAQNGAVAATDFQVGDVRKTDVVRIPFVYEVKADAWENPEKIRGVQVCLPNNLSAWFCRIDDWEMRPYKPLGT